MFFSSKDRRACNPTIIYPDLSGGASDERVHAKLGRRCNPFKFIYMQLWVISLAQESDFQLTLSFFEYYYQ